MLRGAQVDTAIPSQYVKERSEGVHIDTHSLMSIALADPTIQFSLYFHSPHPTQPYPTLPNSHWADGAATRTIITHYELLHWNAGLSGQLPHKEARHAVGGVALIGIRLQTRFFRLKTWCAGDLT